MRSSRPRYEIVFIPPAENAPVVVNTASGADEATLLFATELQRLLSNRSEGELAIRRQITPSAKPNIVVRQQVSYPAR